MRSSARPVTETSEGGRKIPKVEFTFTITLSQLRRMTPEEVIAQMVSMAHLHVPGAVAYAHKAAGRR